MNPIDRRAERLRSWTSETSFGAGSLSDAGVVSSRAIDVVRISESLYPPGDAGQTVLGSGLDPAEADSTIGQCDLIRAMQNDYYQAHDVSSPVWYSERSGPPRRELLDIRSGEVWAGKPTGALFTSDGSDTFPGTWWIRQVATGQKYESASLWRLDPLPHREFMIDSAVTWCAFAARHLGAGGAIDWVDVASSYDSARVTPAAVAAADCFEFEWRGRLLPAPYWETETTVWLRWVFSAPERADAPRS